MINQHIKNESMMQKNLLTSSALHHQQLAAAVSARKFLKGKGSKAPAKDLSKTTFALYLLRFNVALQIAFAANVINLALAIATFWYGLNSLYCAFGMDCVIGTITSCILIWRFASAKHEHLIKHQQQQQQQQQQSSNLYFLNSFTESSSLLYGSKTRLGRLVPAASGAASGPAKFDLLESCRSIAEEDTDISGHDGEDHIRELWSTFWLGQVMILSGIGVVVRTLIEILSHVLLVEAVQVNGQQMTDLVISYNVEGQVDASSSSSAVAATTTSMEPLYYLALISLALNLLLMVAKLVVYLFLRSNSMLIEGVNSFISALFAAVAAVSICYSDSVAYLDQIVSLLFGIFLIIYGGYNMLVTIGQTVYQVVKKSSRPQGYESIV